MNSRETLIFNQPVRIVAQELQSRIILDDQTGLRIRLEQLQPFAKVGDQYREIAALQPGDLWTPQRRTQQSLIVTQREGDTGSCVRILRSSYYDPDKGEYVFMSREGDTAHYLQIPPGAIAKLRVIDKTGILHLFREEAASAVSSEEAEQDLNSLFK